MKKCFEPKVTLPDVIARIADAGGKCQKKRIKEELAAAFECSTDTIGRRIKEGFKLNLLRADKAGQLSLTAKARGARVEDCCRRVAPPKAQFVNAKAVRQFARQYAESNQRQRFTRFAPEFIPRVDRAAKAAIIAAVMASKGKILH